MFKSRLIKLSYFFILATMFTAPVYAATTAVTFAYIGPQDHQALSGVNQGLIEANLQGRFLGQEYRLDIISDEDLKSHDFSPYSAVLSALDADAYINLAETLTGLPVFNLVVGDDSLRAACIENALHTIPGDKMKRDAETQWQKKAPNSSAKARAWHQDFKKFAARDLNKRFLKNHNVAMDDYAWSGWAAVKMVADTVARTNITDPTKLLNYLKTKLSFDGQKGSAMNFRPTGQLRQPILLVENDKIVAEAPVRGSADPPTLDSLGILDCEK